MAPLKVTVLQSHRTR